MEKSKQPIYPTYDNDELLVQSDSVNKWIKDNNPLIGLTKREHFAGLFLQGLLANPNFNGGDALNTVSEKCRSAVAHADALLKELESHE